MSIELGMPPVPPAPLAERRQSRQIMVGSVPVGGGAPVSVQSMTTTLTANVGWQFKVSFVLLLIASLNIFVGAFNMLPLLPLDGGHVAVVAWERIRAWFARLRKRPDPGLVDMAKLLPVSFSIFMVLMFFGVVLVLADIVNPVNIAG